MGRGRGSLKRCGGGGLMWSSFGLRGGGGGAPWGPGRRLGGRLGRPLGPRAPPRFGRVRDAEVARGGRR